MKKILGALYAWSASNKHSQFSHNFWNWAEFADVKNCFAYAFTFSSLISDSLSSVECYYLLRTKIWVRWVSNFIEKSAIVGKNLSFVFKITNCRGLPNKYTDMQCKYKIYLDEKDTLTTKISLTSNPDFNSKGSSINNVIYFSLYFTPYLPHALSGVYLGFKYCWCWVLIRFYLEPAIFSYFTKLSKNCGC